jgi:hypothetical protein
MDSLTFVSSLISSLAWPSVIVALVLVFRTEISRLLPRIKRVKHGESQVDFEEDVKVAVDFAEKDVSLPAVKPGLDQQRLYLLAEQSPRGAILDAWLQVEAALRSYASQQGIESMNSPIQIIRAIEIHSLDGNSIGKGLINMLERLRQLRNDAVHLADAEITTDVAREYTALADRVKKRLEEA